MVLAGIGHQTNLDLDSALSCTSRASLGKLLPSDPQILRL